MVDKKDQDGFFKSLPSMSKEKATKYLIYGLIISIIFSLIVATSMSIAGNANAWLTYANYQNQIGYWEGLYGYSEYQQNLIANQNTRNFMAYQNVIFVNIARVGINIGLILMLIGFIGFATNEKLDEKTRHISLTLAGLILLIVMLSLFFTNVTMNITYT